MKVTRTTCRTVADVSKAPNLENSIRDDRAWLLLDIYDRGYAIYETTTDADGNVKSYRVKVDETKP